jgi:hypothetical protein
MRFPAWTRKAVTIILIAILVVALFFIVKGILFFLVPHHYGDCSPYDVAHHTC